VQTFNRQSPDLPIVGKIRVGNHLFPLSFAEYSSCRITHLAISLIEKRLKDAFPGIKYEVRGTPKDLEGARALAAQNKYQLRQHFVDPKDFR